MEGKGGFTHDAVRRTAAPEPTQPVRDAKVYNSHSRLSRSMYVLQALPLAGGAEGARRGCSLLCESLLLACLCVLLHTLLTASIPSHK